MKKTIQLITSVFCFALAGSSLHATTGTWAAGNDGDWDSSTAGTPWLDGSIPTAPGELALITINCGGLRSVTLNSSRTVGTLTITGGGNNTFTRGYQVVGTGTLVMDNGGNKPELRSLNSFAIINVAVGGNNGFRCSNGSGSIVRFDQANTYTGDTWVYRGTLKVNNVNALPSVTDNGRTGNILFSDNGAGANNGTLDLNGVSIKINGLGTAASTPGALGSIISSAGAVTLTVGDGNASGTYAGTIQDGIQLDKIGSGTLTLNGTVGNGIVNVNGGVLGGNGTINGKVFVYAGGSIGAGASAGIIHLAGGLDLSAGGANIWQLVALKDDSDGTPGTDFDQIDYQWLNTDFDLADSTLTVDLSGVNTADPFWSSSHTWTIIKSFGQTGSSEPSTISVVGGTPAGSFDTANDGTNVKLTFTPGAVPFVPPVPKITSVVPTSPTSVTINYTNTVAGTNYVVQYRTNLNTTNWTHLSPVAAGGTTSSSTDTPPADSSQRFYRVYGKF